MTVFLNILFVWSILGIIFACSYIDAVDGFCDYTSADWMNDKERANGRKIAAWVLTASVIIFVVINIICVAYKIPLLGLIN